jgi:hypothetical protein
MIEAAARFGLADGRFRSRVGSSSRGLHKAGKQSAKNALNRSSPRSVPGWKFAPARHNTFLFKVLYGLTVFTA